MGTSGTRSKLDKGYERARRTGVGVEPGAGSNRKGMPSTKPMETLQKVGRAVARRIVGSESTKRPARAPSTPKPTAIEERIAERKAENQRLRNRREFDRNHPRG